MSYHSDNETEVKEHTETVTHLNVSDIDRRRVILIITG